MVCLFSASYQISFSPPGRSFWPCSLHCRFPSCLRRSLLSLLLLLLPPLLHIKASPTPPAPTQRRAATEGLAQFQGGSDPAATSITSSPLGNYQARRQATPAFEFSGDERPRFLRLCGFVFGIVFLCLFDTSGVAHVCIFHVKEAFSPAKHATHSNTYKQRCQRAQEESRGVWSELLCLCYCFVF